MAGRRHDDGRLRLCDRRPASPATAEDLEQATTRLLEVLRPAA
jgi:hypothetical protein